MSEGDVMVGGSRVKAGWALRALAADRRGRVWGRCGRSGRARCGGLAAIARRRSIAGGPSPCDFVNR